MAIEKNDYNTLNNIQISTSNNRTFYSDVRNIIFFTKSFDIAPTYIQAPQDILDLKISGLDENNEFYKLVASAYTQSYTPINVVIYGNTSATTFTQLYETYEEHENSFEVTNWVAMLDITTDKTYIESVLTYAKTNKDIQVYIGIEYEKLMNISVITDLQKNSNADNVSFFVEGAKNLAIGNYLVGAFVGGTVGYKDLGSWIGHSTEIKGFVQENYTKSEQKSFYDAGLNYLSKPTRGYFHLVNGLNSDNKTFIELKLIEIWLRDRLKKDLTTFQIRKDKIPLNDNGTTMVYSVINEVCRIGAEDGMFMTDSTGNYFGTITQKDKNNNEISIKLGRLTVDILTQESLREGKFKFDLSLTYLNGVRNITLTGKVSTDGELVIEE